MRKQLAIIIPAYKATFLRAALDSIAAQTCQDFTLYIGDDCSPYQLGDIVDKYRGKIDLVYQRFETNLGGKDLVAQWERCIAMSQGEPYIWLFSDDDVMEPGCVDEFYNHLKATNGSYDIYHFNVKILNEKTHITQLTNGYPQSLGNYDYYKGKLMGKYMSLVVENIFSRSVYEKFCGFKKFDLAWGSDTATWVLFSERTGFYTIENTYVLWRSSDENISPDFSNAIVERKVNALLAFFEWSYTYFNSKGKSCLYVNIRTFISRMRMFCNYIPEEQFRRVVGEFCKSHKCSCLQGILFLFIKNLRKKI